MKTRAFSLESVLARALLLLVAAFALSTAVAPQGAAAQGLPDYDGDGLADADEYYYGTDPTYADSDGDGLGDGEEVYIYGTYPTYADSDSDGYYDGEEVYYGGDPLTSSYVDAEIQATYDIYEGAASSAAYTEQAEMKREYDEGVYCNPYMEDNSCD